MKLSYILLPFTLFQAASLFGTHAAADVKSAAAQASGNPTSGDARQLDQAQEKHEKLVMMLRENRKNNLTPLCTSTTGPFEEPECSNRYATCRHATNALRQKVLKILPMDQPQSLVLVDPAGTTYEPAETASIVGTPNITAQIADTSKLPIPIASIINEYAMGLAIQGMFRVASRERVLRKNSRETITFEIADKFGQRFTYYLITQALDADGKLSDDVAIYTGTPQ